MDHLYIELGPDKQLNEIVFAGSHDAGISGGGSNAKTQSLDILGQAQAGVRFFDVRVAAQSQVDHGLARRHQRHDRPAAHHAGMAVRRVVICVFEVGVGVELNNRQALLVPFQIGIDQPHSDRVFTPQRQNELL